MKLSEVLECNGRFRAPNGLEQVLGDDYLYSSNALFRNVRELSLAAGFTFSSEPPFPYRLLPLLCLERIWETRCIPYHANVPALGYVEETRPLEMSFTEVAGRGLQITPTFHESVHCIARLITSAMPQSARLEAKQQWILDRVFEESCANAAETLCAAMCVTTWQKLFGRLNFYVVPDGCGAALDRVGLAAAFQVLTLGYLHANLLLDPPPSKIPRLLRRLLPVDLLQRLGASEAAELFVRGFSLSKAFRYEVASCYWKFIGFNEPLAQLLNVNFVAEFAPGARLCRALNVVSLALEDGVWPSSVQLELLGSSQLLPLEGGKERKEDFDGKKEYLKVV